MANIVYSDDTWGGGRVDIGNMADGQLKAVSVFSNSKKVRDAAKKELRKRARRQHLKGYMKKGIMKVKTFAEKHLAQEKAYFKALGKH